jgi:hypothetical protein
MTTLTDKLTLVSTYTDNDSFKDYICISSDSLLIIDKELELVEWIIQGHDNNGVYMSAENENDFLDAIIVLKNIILLGDNPLDWCKE